MRKYIIGFIAGVVVMVAGNAAADSVSFIGKQIDGEMPVTIDGKPVANAVVTEGKSFAPVRDIAEKTGLSVTVKDGAIELTTPTDEEMKKRAAEEQAKLDANAKAANDAEEAKAKEQIQQKIKQNQINQIKAQIAATEKKKAEWQQELSQTNTSNTNWTNNIKAAIDKLDQEIAELKKQLSELEAE